MSKQRVIELQKSLRVARNALERIATFNHRGEPERLAEEALDELFRLEPKQPLQGIVGHERRAS